MNQVKKQINVANQQTNQNKIRTRYAPSPTGYLHIGGARTALFSYLYAKHFDGDFIVRIEDTDLERNIVDGEKSQLENLIWLGIIPDESPLHQNPKYGKYRQSEKLDRYEMIVKQLLKENKAYKAYDSPEEINVQKMEQEKKGIFSFRYDPTWLKISEQQKKAREKNHQYTVRLKLQPNYVYSWNDIVRDQIDVNSTDIGDFVIWKQNGYPTYNLAVVVDDYDMKISHVLRGEEHITNTPKQLAIYEALGWKAPMFGHLTIITNYEGKKLSKRDTSIQQFIEDYKNLGYPSQAIFNFLALLGWTDQDAREIMSKQELISRFNPERLSKSPTKFDINKMNWFAKSYFKSMSNEEIINNLNLPSNLDQQWLTVFLNIYKQNVATFSELQTILNSYQNLVVKKNQGLENSEVISVFKNQLSQRSFTIENIKIALKNTQHKTGKKGKELFQPLRVAITYKQHGPELASDIWLIGEEIVKQRLK